jgi:hypothetical protein
MSFTKREAADSVYSTAKAINAGVVVGASTQMMENITASRLAHIDAALAAVDAAVGSDKILLREPDNEKLAQMRADLEVHRERIAAILPERRVDKELPPE